MWTIIFSLWNIVESLKSTNFAAAAFFCGLDIHDVKMYDWQEGHSEGRGAKKGYIINLKL